MFQPAIAMPSMSEDTDYPGHSPSVSSGDTGLTTGGSANILLSPHDTESIDKLNGGTTKTILSTSDSGDETDEGV